MILRAKFVIEPNLRLVFEDGDNAGYLSFHLEYNNYVWEDIDENQSIMARADFSKCFRLAYCCTFSGDYPWGRQKLYKIKLRDMVN